MPVKPVRVATSNLPVWLHDTSAVHGRVLFIENIHPDLITLLGETLDVDPLFFAGHIVTDFQEIEKAPPPPPLALFPSQAAERGYLHIHSQQVLDLGSADTFKHATYTLKTDSNIPRNVRRLPHLLGRQLALARACCSVLLTKLNDSWICLVLTDLPITTVIENLKSGGRNTYPAAPLQGGYEDFEQATTFSSYRFDTSNPSWDKTSVLSSLLHYFRNPPPRFTTTQPSILSLGYYPLRITLAEWNVYTNLMSRYLKHYEYSLRDIHSRLHDNDIVDLQRWRRRSKQSMHKLTLLRDFINHWLQREADKQPWDTVLKDIQYVRMQLDQYSTSLEQMVPVATSMVQLLDSRRSMLDAANVKRLTHIALIFVPLSWVASLFSMSDTYSPGHAHFWVYFATALPLLLLVLLLSAIQSSHPVEMLKGFGEMLRRQTRSHNGDMGVV